MMRDVVIWQAFTPALAHVQWWLWWRCVICSGAHELLHGWF